MVRKIVLILLAGLTVLLAPSGVLAAFDANKVIDDDAFTNTSSMSASKIQQFLDDRRSVLAGFVEGGRSAAGIIYDAAQKNGINPQVLLATLQKEQSLLTTGTSYNTSTDPSSKLRTAMGYACPDSGGCDARYAGFTNQVDGAAFQFRFNFDGSTTKKFTDYQVNQTMTFDGTAVIINNRATAALYRYTPHISGNRSFYNIFFTYFLDYSSHWASQNSFPTLAPGDSYKFSFGFENVGNKAWERGTVKLGTDYPKDRVPRFLLENRTGNGEDTMWTTANRIGLTQGTVAPGKIGTFDLYKTVPNTLAPGTYREYFRPVVDGVQWLDDDQVYSDVTVAHHQAAWAGQNFGSQAVEPGQSIQLELKLRNTGKTTWRRDGQTPVRLGTSRTKDRSPAFIREDLTGNNPSGWATANRISLVESTVAPDEIGTFRFWYTIPKTVKPGTYKEYFQPIHENVRWMDDLGMYFELVVGPQKATLVSQSGYPTLSKGESAQFTVKFLNSGTTTWRKNGDTPIRLATLQPTDRSPKFIREDVQGRNSSGWVKENRVAMVEDEVKPGEIGSFSFWYTVPSDKAAGTYREHFGLVQEEYGPVTGNLGLYWDITVK